MKQQEQQMPVVPPSEKLSSRPAVSFFGSLMKTLRQWFKTHACAIWVLLLLLLVFLGMLLFCHFFSKSVTYVVALCGVYVLILSCYLCRRIVARTAPSPTHNIFQENVSDAGSEVSPAPLKGFQTPDKVVPAVKVLPAAEDDVPLLSSPIKDEEGERRAKRLASLQSCAEGIKDDDLRALALDRLQEIRQHEDSPEGRALAAVDFWDELHGMRNAYEGDDQRCIIRLGKFLIQALSENGCERLDSDSWQPDIQRAIEIDRTLSPGSEPKIAEKYRSGLRVRGRLVRKQEVHLLKPHNNNEYDI